jgi:hypothetical protein
MSEQMEGMEVTEETPVDSGVIEVQAKKGEREATITYDFGKNLDEMVEKFGADIVHQNARANMKISLQGLMRRKIDAGESCDSLAENWKPGTVFERTVDPLATARKALANMSEEEKQAFIEKLLSK